MSRESFRLLTPRERRRRREIRKLFAWTPAKAKMLADVLTPMLKACREIHRPKRGADGASE